MAEDLKTYVLNFRKSDLQLLLDFAGRNKYGKKHELQIRALDLVNTNFPHVITKVKEIHYRREQLSANYSFPNRTLTDRPVSNYDSAMNKNNGLRCFRLKNAMSVLMSHGSVPTYPDKPYMPPVSTQTHYLRHADVTFRELPFYDTKYTLLRPFTIIPDPLVKCQESNYTFSLSSKEVQDIAVSKNASEIYECQILLRFCLLEAGTEQDDHFPPHIFVKVNGKPVPLPNLIPTNTPGAEPKRPGRPLNITPFTNLSPNVNNSITVTWTSSHGHSYAGILYIARMVTSLTLLQRLKNRGPCSPEKTKAMIVEKLQKDQDSDIATTSLQASLLCPLGKLKMNLPCRALTCTHIACFDALLYIQLNEKKPKWRCPVCDKLAFFKNLIVDGLFMDIVSKVPDECTDVEMHDDGSWTPVIPTKENSAKEIVIERKKNSLKVEELVDIASDDDTDAFNDAAKATPGIMSCSDKNLLCPAFSAESAVTPECSSRTLIDEPVPVYLTSDVEFDMQLSDHSIILPDIISHPEDLLPSTSSSGQSSSTYPKYLSSNSSTFYKDKMNALQKQSSCENNQSSDLRYSNDFDMLNILLLPESEKLQYENMPEEEPEKDQSPEVIVLD